MTAMLRHKPTGDLYVRTSLLAVRDDMEAVDELRTVISSLAIGEREDNTAPKKSAKPVRKAVDALSASLDSMLDADAAD